MDTPADVSAPRAPVCTVVPLDAAPRALLEWHPHAHIVLDADLRIRYANQAALAFAVMDEDALIGRSLWEGFPTQTASIVHEACDRCRATGATAHTERYDHERDQWLSATVFPAADDLVAILSDVTARRHADRSLQENEAVLSLAQEVAGIGSFDVDLRTDTMLCSDQLLRLLGVDAETDKQALHTTPPFFNVVHPDDRAAVQEAWNTVRHGGTRQSVRIRVCRADGDQRHMMWSAMLVRDPRDEPVRMVGTYVDITEQVRGEEERARVDSQLQQAQKLESLGVLAGGIAHDFNNLLVGILGNASLAMLDLEPGAVARESVSQIEQAGQRAAELTRQLLAYAGKGRYVVEPTDATAVISDMTSLLRTAISRNASLQLDLITSLPTIEVDVNQFRQVVMNLVTNASDALDAKPGLIRISTGRQEVSREYLATCAPGGDARLGTHTFVEVHDSGTGMDEITRQRMFEPFFSTKFTGRGLGLAATMGIMRSHHGAVRVESELGSGTTVRLLFPSSASSGRDGIATGSETELRHGDGQILVVDDEAGVRAVASALLRRRGFRTQEASDGAMAMELFRAQPDAFDLVLLDLTMPTMGGEATLQALREVKPSVRVVLMSGHNETDVTRLFAGRNLSGYLQKPFRAEELYASIARCLPV